MNNKLRIGSLFAGVGGIELAFEQTGKFKTIWANDYDCNAVITYRNNFDNLLITEDIRNIETFDLPNVDIILSGFPCTSFSVAGYRKGFEDENSGDLFFEVLRILKEKRPPIIFIENVKNLVGHDKGKTFRIICDGLQSQGYCIKYQVLNAKDFGNVPQNRERIYLVGFKNKEHYKNFEFPSSILLEKKITDMLEVCNDVHVKYYYTSQKCSFFDVLDKSINSFETLYQWRRKYVRENKSGVCPTLTANMGTGGHNVPIVKTIKGIRKLTPRECFNFQGYPKSFILPNIADSHLYKQAGNSVVVPVVKRIAENIIEAIL